MVAHDGSGRHGASRASGALPTTGAVDAHPAAGRTIVMAGSMMGYELGTKRTSSGIDGRYEGRAAHQAPDVDGSTTLEADRPLAPGDLVIARVTESAGADLIASA